jgi:hypothetical protein
VENGEESYAAFMVAFKFEKEYTCEPGQADGLANTALVVWRSDSNCESVRHKCVLKLSTHLLKRFPDFCDGELCLTLRSCG